MSGEGRSGGRVVPFPLQAMPPPVVGGTGGPHDPTMEMRVQRLEDTFGRVEALMKSVDDRLRAVEINVAEAKGRVAHLPSTWAMIGTVLGGQAVFAATILAILHFALAH